MKKMIGTKVLILLLSLGMVLGLVTTGSAETAPAVSSNVGSYEYTYNRWATPVDSYLLNNEDGSFTRVEYVDNRVVVEQYNSSYAFVSGGTIEMELPIFGGFYEGTDSFFLIEGQENPNEDENCEVVRVIRYTKDWERVSSASLYGANTVEPFAAGSLRCVEYNGYLYIRTSHKMYQYTDGKNHQSNMTLNVRISDMTVTDSCYVIASQNRGYASHSFNQFITVADGKLVAVDHGDSYPRSVMLTRYLTPAGQDLFLKDKGVSGDGYVKYADTLDVLPIGGISGNNDTGVSVGGFEASDSHYLIAGNTIDQGKTFDRKGQRNIFIAATDVDNFTSGGTVIRYLTNHTSGVTVSNPQMVKINQNRYLVLWKETSGNASVMRWAFVDGTGKLIGTVYSGSGEVSDCQPIVSGSKLVWYVTSNSGPAFMTIDLNDPTEVTHQHVNTYSYVSYPSDTTDGRLTSVCGVCGAPGEDVIIPAIRGCSEYTLASTDRAPTCTTEGYGYFTWSQLSKYNVAQYMFGGSIPALGHQYKNGVCTLCGDVSSVSTVLLGEVKSSGTGSVTITLSQSGEVVYSTTTTGTDYLLDNILPGAYTLTVSKEKHVQRSYTVTVTVTEGENRLDLKIHLIGDINGDGRVNVGDVSKIYAYAKKNGTLTDYEFLCADVTGDGRVNVGDASRVYGHSKKTSSLW